MTILRIILLFSLGSMGSLAWSDDTKLSLTENLSALGVGAPQLATGHKKFLDMKLNGQAPDSKTVTPFDGLGAFPVVMNCVDGLGHLVDLSDALSKQDDTALPWSRKFLDSPADIKTPDTEKTISLPKRFSHLRPVIDLMSVLESNWQPVSQQAPSTDEILNLMLDPSFRVRVAPRQADRLISIVRDHADTPLPVDSTLSILGRLRQIAATLDGAWPKRIRRLETPHGTLAIGTTGNDVYDQKDWIVVDPGGDDLYFGSYGSAIRGCSVVIDLKGNDRYLQNKTTRYEEGLAQGSAVAGASAIIDLEGNDRYHAENFSQGSAVFGVGLLWDCRGDDRYTGDGWVQGAAAWGLGWLRDDEGRDVYQCGWFGQGLGRCRGFGVLQDKSGDDNYVATDRHASYYSTLKAAAETQQNIFWSYAQGCGAGWYLRYSQKELGRGNSPALAVLGLIPGGVGLLDDEAGDDSYKASKFGQGCSYLYSLGLLRDSSGNDTYVVQSSGQGSSVHFSSAMLLDLAGNDTYTAHAASQGNMRDFGSAILRDLSGNDRYTAHAGSQGMANGPGSKALFVDHGGDDLFSIQKDGWGTVLPIPKVDYDTLGIFDHAIFLDLGGQDTFKGALTRTIAEDGSWSDGTGRGRGRDKD